jgi:HAD superfamily hydrolase (TIGR01509 family)
MIKAVIFDMDGVLIDAKDWHYEALNRALRLFGYEISRYDHLTTYDGLPTSKKLEMLSVQNGLPKKLHRFINEMKQQYTTELVRSLCRPRFKHEYALSKLKAAGYHLAVASNSIRNTVELMMDNARLKAYLDFMLSNEDVEQPKPSPDIYLKAIKKLGLTPKECLIVEDNEHGIRAATASGAHLLVVRTVDEVNYNNLIRRIDECNNEV